MNELNVVDTKDKTVEEDEGLKILADAENIIQQTNNKHSKTKKFIIFFVILVFNRVSFN